MKIIYVLMFIFIFAIAMASPISEAAVVTPENVSEFNITNSSFMLTWDAVSNATSYNVQLTRNPSFASYIQNNNTASPSFTFTNLQSATTYYYRINASDGPATSEFIDGQTATFTNAGDTGLYLGGLLSMNFEKISNIIFFFFFMGLAAVFYILGWSIVSAIIVLLSGIILIFSGINILIGCFMLILSAGLILANNTGF